MSANPNRFKSGLRFGLLSGLLTLILASLFLPRLMTWYFEPPANMGYSCSPSVAHALDLFRVIQALSLILGSIFGFILAFRWSRSPSNPPPSSHQK